MRLTVLTARLTKTAIATMAIAITINEAATMTITQNIGSLVLICSARTIIISWFCLRSSELRRGLTFQSSVFLPGKPACPHRLLQPLCHPGVMRPRVRFGPPRPRAQLPGNKVLRRDRALLRSILRHDLPTAEQLRAN